jgi:hypothetical protein
MKYEFGCEADGMAKEEGERDLLRKKYLHFALRNNL